MSSAVDRVEDTRKIELQNVTPAGQAPKRRLASPEAAASIFSNLKDEYNRVEAKRMAVIQGMIDGNPPYVQTELDELGLGSMINVNFMTMRANLDARAAAGHELFAEVPSLIECVPLAAQALSPDVNRFCSIVAEEFTEMVTGWDGFLSSMDMIWRDCDAYGIGVAMFENEWDWRFKAFKRGNILFDPKASIDLDRNEFLMVRDELSVADIHKLLQDEGTAKARGWKVGPLKDQIIRVFQKGEQANADEQYQRSMWESIQQMYRNNDYEYQQKQFHRIRVVHIFVKEVADEQKVSHLILPELTSNQVFLFENYGRYEKMSQAVWWLPYNYGDGYARSVRGVASYMVQHDDLSNRFLCRVFDAGFMTSSLLLQPQGQLDLARLQFVQHGPITIIPPNTTAVQSTFQPQIAPLIQLRGVSEQVMKNNTGTYRQHNEAVERETQKTARQVVEETSKEARFEKAAIASRYVHLDRLYREMLRRVFLRDVHATPEVEFPGARETRALLKRCVERGVPREFLLDWEKNFRVSAYRSVGLGSLGVKYDITNQLLSVSGSFDEAGKREALRTWVEARVGCRNADKYVARIDRDQIASNESSISILEWNDISEGSEAVVGTDQNHKLHVDVFLPRMAQIMQAAETGQVRDPLAAYRTLMLAIQHVQAHLQILSQDKRREDYVKQVVKFLQAADRARGMLEQAAKRVLQAQQDQAKRNQEVVANAEKIEKDRELEAKIFEIQRKFELERLKQDSLNKAREDKTQVQQAIKTRSAEEELRLKAERQAAEIRLLEARTAAEIAAKTAAGR